MTTMTRNAAVAAAEKIPGWMSRPELQWLADRAAALPAEACWLEIGVHTGRSLLAVGLMLPPKAQLAAVDLGLWGHEREGWKFQRTLDQLIQSRPDLRLTLCRTTARAALSHFAPGTLDVVFIDADHSYDGTSREILDYRPALKPGGLICGHDYNRKDWPGVVQAVDEHLPQRQLGPGSLWYQRQ